MRALWLALVLLLTVGCGSGERSVLSLAGTNDVELSYDAEGAATEDLRALVIRRLGAAQVGADVSESDRGVRVVVDESLASKVDELVTWPGTLMLYQTDPAVALPSRMGPLTAGGSGDERWFEGTRADVVRAVETWPIDREHRVLAEPMWDRGTWRTRVVRAAHASELGDGAMIAWGDGPTLRIRGVAGTPASDVIRAAKTAGQVVARGRISLGAPGFDDDALILHFGRGAEGYTRAQRERQLLLTSRIPALRRVDAIGLPPNRSLATACLVVPIALSLAWLAFVRRFDRAHPEPTWLIAVTFLCGALSTVPAAIAEILLASATPWLNPTLVTFGGHWFAFPLAFAVFSLVVGLSEEGAKRLAAQVALRRREFDEPVDGIVYGIVSSLGFAAAENVQYFASGRLAAPLVIARCFMSVPAHMFFGAVWGYALGARLVDKRTRTFVWLLVAAAFHGLFDALLSTEGAGFLAIVLNLGLASLFVVLVRRALRHGIVSDEMLLIRPEDRLLFRVGRAGLFWFAAIALHVLAFWIFVLGAYYQLARHRPSPLFVVGSSVLLGLLAFAALGVSSALPLDVVVDDYGVTFAGAARPWRKIRGVKRHPDRAELECEDGPIWLGPTSTAGVDEIVRAIEGHLYTGGQRLSTLESRQFT